MGNSTSSSLTGPYGPTNGTWNPNIDAWVDPSTYCDVACTREVKIFGGIFGGFVLFILVVMEVTRPKKTRPTTPPGISIAPPMVEMPSSSPGPPPNIASDEQNTITPPDISVTPPTILAPSSGPCPPPDKPTTITPPDIPTVPPMIEIPSSSSGPPSTALTPPGISVAPLVMAMASESPTDMDRTKAHSSAQLTRNNSGTTVNYTSHSAFNTSAATLV